MLNHPVNELSTADLVTGFPTMWSAKSLNFPYFLERLFEKTAIPRIEHGKQGVYMIMHGKAWDVKTGIARFHQALQYFRYLMIFKNTNSFLVINDLNFQMQSICNPFLISEM